LIASRAQERAPQVDGEHLLEVGLGELVGRTRDLDAGVVDQHVDRSELVDGLLDHLDHVVLLGHVALHEHVLHRLLADLPEAGMHLLLGLGCLLGPREVVDRDARTVFGETHRGRLPDSRGAAGHEHVLPFNPRIVPGA
jgi:hypothetical protein